MKKLLLKLENLSKTKAIPLEYSLKKYLIASKLEEKERNSKKLAKPETLSKFLEQKSVNTIKKNSIKNNSIKSIKLSNSLKSSFGIKKIISLNKNSTSCLNKTIISQLGNSSLSKTNYDSLFFSKKSNSLLNKLPRNESINIDRYLNEDFNKKSQFMEENIKKNSNFKDNFKRENNSNDLIANTFLNKFSYFKKNRKKKEDSFVNIFSVRRIINDEIENELNIIENYQEKYLEIKNEDYKIQKIINENWSGSNVLEIKGITIKKLKKIFYHLSHYNKDIWIFGFEGIVCYINFITIKFDF